MYIYLIYKIHFKNHHPGQNILNPHAIHSQQYCTNTKYPALGRPSSWPKFQYLIAFTLNNIIPCIKYWILFTWKATLLVRIPYIQCIRFYHHLHEHHHDHQQSVSFWVMMTRGCYNFFSWSSCLWSRWSLRSSWSSHSASSQSVSG